MNQHYKMSPSDKIAKVTIYTILVIIALICLLPMWHVLMTSLSDPDMVSTNQDFLFLPLGKISFYGYEKVFANQRLLRSYLVTIIAVVGSTVFGLIIMLLAAYVISRPNLYFKKPLTIFFLITLFFSGGNIPLYTVVNTMGLTNTIFALIIPGAANAFFLILLKNGMESIPEALVEAARIDGAGHLQVLFKVILPLSIPYIAVVSVFSVIMHWNSWLNASMFITRSNRHLYPLQLVLRELLVDQALDPNANIIDNSRMASVRAAAIMVSSLPLIIAYPFFQKYFEKGMIIGGVKG